MKTPACIIGISGYSGSGKTTLIEKVLAELKGEGLTVGTLKHTSHHILDLDREEKDTNRFYRAGAAAVIGQDEEQCFVRCPIKGADHVDALKTFARGLDLILVEGHKGADIPRIWLEHEPAGSRQTPHPSGKVQVINRNDAGYLGICLRFIHEEMEKHHAARIVRAGLLIGGKSSRMGRPKALLEFKGLTLAEKIFQTLSSVAEQTVLLGASELPPLLHDACRLPDVPGAQGPMSGMLSAFRWDPASAWIISAVDMPLMDAAALKWLLDQRRPGIWAVMPRLESDSAAETTGACYEPLIFDHVESLCRRGITKLQGLTKHPKVATPLIPKGLAYAWRNVNTTREWEEVIKT